MIEMKKNKLRVFFCGLYKFILPDYKVLQRPPVLDDDSWHEVKNPEFLLVKETNRQVFSLLFGNFDQ